MYVMRPLPRLQITQVNFFFPSRKVIQIITSMCLSVMLKKKELPSKYELNLLESKVA